MSIRERLDDFSDRVERDEPSTRKWALLANMAAILLAVIAALALWCLS